MANDSVRTRTTRTAARQPCPHCAKYYWQTMCKSIGRVTGPTGNMIPKRPDFNPVEMIFPSPGGSLPVNSCTASSTLYRWYVEDFGGSVDTVLTHLRRYARPGLKHRLESVKDIAGGRYDSDLNEATGKFLP